MHRIMTVPRLTFARVSPRFGHRAWRSAVAGVLLAAALLQVPGRALAQPMAPAACPPPIGLIISVGETEARRPFSGQRIKSVSATNSTVITIDARDPAEIKITGMRPGLSKLTLTDANNTSEVFDVLVVPFDIRHLIRVIKKAVPTANVCFIPAGTAIVVSGTVDSPEDVPIILQTAQGVVGGVQVINALRVGGVQQVQLDVVVAQVQRSEFRQMAFDFLGIIENTVFTSTTGNTVVPGLASVLTVGGPNTASLTPAFGVNAPNFTVGVINPQSGIQTFLQALRTEGLLKLIAEPRLVVMSGRQASFLSGGEQAVPIPAGLGQIGVQFEEFGTRLNVIPVVLGNGRIHLEVEPEVSDLSVANGTSIQGTVVPGRTTQRVRTTVELEAGQTFVIGGLIQHTINASTVKAPILGDLPVFGALFSSKSFQEVETELVILVTPHLVDGMDCSQYPTCLPGQETRSPDDFELFLEGILEAPRGPRAVCHGKVYVPAYKNGPTAGMFPCGGNGHHGHHGSAMHGGVPGCPTCPGGMVQSQPGVIFSGEAQLHTARKMPAAPAKESKPAPAPQQKTEPIRTMPVKQMPATLPALDAPVLPRR